MNTDILKKCLAELQSVSTEPRIDYVCGMLETLIAMQPAAPKEKVMPDVVTRDETLYVPPTRLDVIKRLAEESSH